MTDINTTDTKTTKRPSRKVKNSTDSENRTENKALSREAVSPDVFSPGQLHSVSIPLDDLKERPDNARTHDQRNIDTLVSSLKRFGQVEPLLVQKGSLQIIGGHGRKTAMLALGWTRADVTLLDVDDERALALNATLNRSAELSGWDFEKLGSQFRALQDSGWDLVELGWLDFEVEPILAADWTPPALQDLETFGARSSGDGETHFSTAVTDDEKTAIESAIKRAAKTLDSGATDGAKLAYVCRQFQ
jgi:hypothetical protein